MQIKKNKQISKKHKKATLSASIRLLSRCSCETTFPYSCRGVLLRCSFCGCQAGKRGGTDANGGAEQVAALSSDVCGQQRWISRRFPPRRLRHKLQRSPRIHVRSEKGSLRFTKGVCQDRLHVCINISGNQQNTAKKRIYMYIVYITHIYVYMCIGLFCFLSAGDIWFQLRGIEASLSIRLVSF